MPALYQAQEVLLPGSINLTCKATWQCVSSNWSSAAWQVKGFWPSLFIHLIDILPEIYLFVHFLSVVHTVSCGRYMPFENIPNCQSHMDLCHHEAVNRQVRC